MPKSGPTRLADRVLAFDSSGIRKVFDLAQQLEAPIDLSIGQPDFDVPGPLKAEAKRWLDAGFNKYTVTQGIPELRERVRAKYEAQGLDVGETIITSGVSGGIVLALLALVNPGDEVLVPDPYFVMYKHLTNLIGGVPRMVNVYPDFVLTAEAVEAAVTPKTRLLFVNSPANPTGAVLDEAGARAIAAVAERHNLVLVSDEIYECFQYDSAPVNIARFWPKTVILNGLSKSHAMTGWRLGWAAGPAEIVREMIKVQQYSFVCAPSFVQKAAVKAFDEPTDAARDAYRRKRDLIYEGLKDRFNVVKPGGAFYLFPEAPGGDGAAFAELAVKNNVLVVPGNVFSDRNTHFRISFAAPDETLRQGIEVLNSLA
jgi:aspartate/methionine/tyrosine aminotransferase